MNKIKYNPKLYFLLTFIATYILWFTGAVVRRQENGESSYMIFMILGLISPFLISTILILSSKDKNARKDFTDRLFNFRRIDYKMIPVMLFIMPLSVIISAFISILFGGDSSQLQFAEGFSFSTGFVPVLIVLLLAALFEELGWRGYAFDSLQNRFNLKKATLFFGILWSLWHLPLVFVINSYQWEIWQQNPLYAINFFIGIIPLGVIITWICIKNEKSIPAAVIFHFITNISQEMLNISQNTKCIQTIVIAIVAGLIIKYDKKVFN